MLRRNDQLGSHAGLIVAFDVTKKQIGAGLQIRLQLAAGARLQIFNLTQTIKLVFVDAIFPLIIGIV